MPTLTFKVNDDEARRLRALAKQENLTLSELIRQRTLAPGGGARRVRRVRCRETGVMLFSSPSGGAPLTTESVREMLADFP